MYDGDSVWTLEVDLAGPVHQAARHEGGAVIQVPVLPDGVDTGLEKEKLCTINALFSYLFGKTILFHFCNNKKQ